MRDRYTEPPGPAQAGRSRCSQEQREGSPVPLGATWIDAAQAYNFALYSKHAERVTLLLYGAEDVISPLCSVALRFPANKTNRVWHCRVDAATVGAARYYAYRIEGPWQPDEGHLFDDSKILLDPYASAVFFPPGFSRSAAARPGSNAGQAPLGVLPPRGRRQAMARPRGPRHDHDLVIYELHVRGFTRHANAGVPDTARGTFAGIIAKIPYLKSLGVTAVELMPVQQFDPLEGNYWGYMTLNFFAPHLGYAQQALPEEAVAEFRAMVDALHQAGMEVFLDVVYNHTTEGDARGPVYSFRGIDNSTYYALDPNDLSHFANYSACGNDLRTAHPVVRRLVVDSLRYWTREMGVDGFRFDLASIFTRSDDGSVNLDDPAIISEISGDPDLAEVRLIAEPWQGAPGGGYLMGRAFPGMTWRQWNDHFRDTLRQFVRGDEGMVPALMTRLYGSTDLLPDTQMDAFRRYQSINYIASHDGLILRDLVSYNDAGQHSWNCGFEGTAGAPPDVETLRRQQVKTLFALLMLANGTPMFVAGDEFMQTQFGNANPWNQDNETAWLDWSLAETNAEMVRFFRMMIAFRKAHPMIGRSTGWGEAVSWHGVGAEPDLAPDSHSLAYHLRGAPAEDDDLYVMINGWREDLVFSIQAPGGWRRVVDTALPGPADIADAAAAPPLPDRRCTVRAHSAVVLVRREETRPGG